MTHKGSIWPWTQTLRLRGGVAHAECLIDGSRNEDRNHLVIASNSACSDDRRELGPETPKLGGPSSNPDRVLSSRAAATLSAPFPKKPTLFPVLALMTFAGVQMALTIAILLTSTVSLVRSGINNPFLLEEALPAQAGCLFSNSSFILYFNSFAKWGASIRVFHTFLVWVHLHPPFLSLIFPLHFCALKPFISSILPSIFRSHDQIFRWIKSNANAQVGTIYRILFSP